MTEVDKRRERKLDGFRWISMDFDGCRWRDVQNKWLLLFQPYAAIRSHTQSSTPRSTSLFAVFLQGWIRTTRLCVNVNAHVHVSADGTYVRCVQPRTRVRKRSSAVR